MTKQRSREEWASIFEAVVRSSLKISESRWNSDISENTLPLCHSLCNPSRYLKLKPHFFSKLNKLLNHNWLRLSVNGKSPPFLG